MDNPVLYQLVFFSLNFLSILATLLFYTILAWVIANWLILFNLMTPANRIYGLLTQLIMPVVKPFRWARIGMLDLSPLLALLALDLAMNVLGQVLIGMLG